MKMQKQTAPYRTRPHHWMPNCQDPVPGTVRWLGDLASSTAQPHGGVEAVPARVVTKTERTAAR